MKKKTVLSLFAALTTVSLAACSTGNDNNSVEFTTTLSEPVELSFYHSMSGTLGESLNALIDEFNQTVGKEKGIFVEAVYQGDYNQLKSKTIAAIKSGEAPNLVQATGNDVVEFLASGTVQPLNEYVFHEEVGIEDYEDIYETYRSESQQYDEEGTIYSLPFSKSTDVFYYNKTFFDEHGLKVPTTWSELEELSKKITEITGRSSFGIDNAFNFLKTGLDQLTGDFDSATGYDAQQIIKMMKENIDSGNWRLSGEDKYHSGVFMSGLVQCYVGSSAGASYLSGADFEWAAAPIPQFSEDSKSAIQQGNSLAVLNGNATSEEVYASYEVIKFLTSHEGNLFWTLNTGYSPIRQSVSDSEEFKEYVKETNDTAKSSAAEQSSYMNYETAFINDNGISSNTVRSEVGYMIEEIILTDKDINEALDQYKQKLQ